MPRIASGGCQFRGSVGRNAKLFVSVWALHTWLCRLYLCVFGDSFIIGRLSLVRSNGLLAELFTLLVVHNTIFDKSLISHDKTAY